jgi:hypothetical protein
MARRSPTARAAELAFDAISIEGGLLGADWLSRAAQLKAPQQDPADYGVPKGIELRDEIGRSWRIAQAHWAEFEAGRKAKAEPDALCRRFVLSLLREALAFFDLVEREHPLALGEQSFPLTAIDGAGRVPVVTVASPSERSSKKSALDEPHAHFGDEHRKRSAFGLVQEFLNVSKDALWGLCSDGLSLRIVRDNASLTRPAWIEIDLARIFTEGLYPDFAATWLVLHRSRFGRPNQEPASCALETWRASARAAGTRARDRLRGGFEEAILALGQGFLAHPSNQALRKALHNGTLSKKAYFGELLRLAYRLIFLLAIEERGLLHPKGTAKDAEERYTLGYSVKRLRDRSSRRAAHDRHGDLWEALKIVFRGLSAGEPALGLPALGGLFTPSQCSHLDAASVDNRALLGAIFKLCWLKEPNGLSRVNWRDMGADELGYVYEGLLELVPQITQDGRTFSFAGADESRGNARKTSGSYYTPDSLVELLLKSALDPVIDNTIARSPGSPAKALLELAVVDPACGSGHFLLAAARRIAERVARLQSSGTPTPDDYRHALRQVVGRCIYGVDLNPLAVELCKVALWMEAVDPGLPLTFLDAHIREGNALLGTTRAVMGDEVPDEAWAPLEGDDKKVATSLKKRNKSERVGQEVLPLGTSVAPQGVRDAVEALDAAPDTTAADVSAKERRWSELLASEPWKHAKLVHDAWCAAFVWPKEKAGPLTESAPTTAVWRALREGRSAPAKLLVETTEKIARDYRLFHWELAFPTVFARGGFDVVLGNPPWERVKLAELEFFASRDDSIAGAIKAADRKKLIAELPVRNPELWEDWSRESRVAQGTSHFVRASGRYPLCGKGDVNTYALFAEHNRQVLGPLGRGGFIVPSGIATDDTTKWYFQSIMRERALRAMWEFENEGFFTAGKGHMLRFALTTLVGKDAPVAAADFMFQGQSVADLDDPQRHFALTADDIETLNPNTGTCPIFRTQRDARLAVALYRRAGVLWREDDPNGNAWGLRFTAMFHMTSDSGLFQTRGALASAGWQLRGNRFALNREVMLPLYEAKMVSSYNHRAGSFAATPGERPHRLPTISDAELSDPSFTVLPFYWVQESEVQARLETQWSHDWLMGWRDVTDARASVRTVVPFLFPRAGVGNTIFVMFPRHTAASAGCLYANLSSIPLDYAARQKVGGLHLTYAYMKQLPVLLPSVYGAQTSWDSTVPLQAWILPRVLELTYTAWDLQPFARDCGDEGPPYIWNPERRFVLQAELDAAFFHLYGISRDDAEYILGTFDVLERADVRQHGEYRTKRVVLERYDALATAAASGKPYVSPLSPPRRAS